MSIKSIDVIWKVPTGAVTITGGIVVVDVVVDVVDVVDVVVEVVDVVVGNEILIQAYVSLVGSESEPDEPL